MSEPLVSVVIASYNAGRYLAETLNGALGQTHRNIEIIVVDDGSTDATLDVVGPFLDRIRFVPRPHLGIAATRNLALSMAQGDYITNLDADDVWTPDAMAVQLEVARRNPRSGLIACDGVEFDGPTVLDPRLLRGPLAAELDRSRSGEITGDFHHQLIRCGTVCCPAQVLIPRPVLEAIGPFADLDGQDYEYNLRIAQRYPITLHSRALARWRYRPDSLSGPRERRPIVHAWVMLDVLETHRKRCGPADQPVLRERSAELMRQVAYDAYHRAIAGDPAGDRDLARLLRIRPRLPIVPLYRIGLRLPGSLRSAATRGLRALRRINGWRTAARRVERLDPALDKLVPPGARVRSIASGFAYTEGPIWMPGGYLLFGDLPNNVIRRWDARNGASVVRERSGYAAADIPPGAAMGSNGMTLDRAGRLTICEPGNRRVTRIEEDGRIVVLADRYDGKRLNSPNDLVYKSDGALYFTDPPHGLVGEDLSPEKELAFNGLYRVAGGQTSLLCKEMTRPNGLAFSPDERYLYVSNSDPRNKLWMRFEVRPDGTLGDGSVFLDLNSEPGQPPDGLKVDREGNLYLTGPGGLWIVSAEGRILGRIRTEFEPSNCAWGDADGRTLYLTTHGEVNRIRLLIPGVLPMG